MRYLLFLFVILLTACGVFDTSKSEQGMIDISCACKTQPTIFIVSGTGDTMEEAINNAKEECDKKENYVFDSDSCTEGAISVPLKQ